MIINSTQAGVTASSTKVAELWENLSNTLNKVLNGFKIIFAGGGFSVNYGNSVTGISSNVSYNKTLAETSKINLFLNSNARLNSVTDIISGTSAPRLGGAINLSSFPNLQQFRCVGNDINSVTGYENNSNITHFIVSDNELTGSMPTLITFANLVEFKCETNQLTGSIPTLNGLSFLQTFVCASNQLTGSIPALSTTTNLRNFYCSFNQLTGPLPSLSGLTKLLVFHAGNNGFTGSIPVLSGCPLLNDFRVPNCQLTSFAGGSVSNTLGQFLAQNNQLTSTAVNAILAAFVAAGRTSASGTCILNLAGTGNSSATGQGITDKDTLIARGWTVTIN